MSKLQSHWYLSHYKTLKIISSNRKNIIYLSISKAQIHLQKPKRRRRRRKKNKSQTCFYKLNDETKFQTSGVPLTSISKLGCEARNLYFPASNGTRMRKAHNFIPLTTLWRTNNAFNEELQRSFLIYKRTTRKATNRTIL